MTTVQTSKFEFGYREMPALWVTLVPHRDRALGILSSWHLSKSERDWLAAWLTQYSLPRAPAEWSHIFLTFGSAEFANAPADGEFDPRAVETVVYGWLVNDPPGEWTSTSAAIFRRAIALLESDLEIGALTSNSVPWRRTSQCSRPSPPVQFADDECRGGLRSC